MSLSHETGFPFDESSKMNATCKLDSSWRCRHGWLRGEQCPACKEIEELTAERDALKIQLVVAEGASASLDIFNDQLIAERDALTADRDSWRQQCSDRVADAVRFAEERDAWEKNCNDQIDLLNFTANERDAAEAACQILALEVGELQTDVKKLGKWSDEVHAENMALRADAQRYQWLASDDRTQVDWDRMLIAFLSGRLAAEIDAAIAGEKK